MMRWVLPCGVIAGCAAPPIGLGAGPISPSPGRVSIEGRAAMGAAAGRQAFQAETSMQVRFVRAFAMESGVAVTRVSQRDGDGDVAVFGAFPYARPRVIVGDVSLAVALSGGGMGGGGGGLFGGIVDAQLAYGRQRWGVYVGGYRHGFELVAEDAIDTSSRQARVGGQIRFPSGAMRLGVALELFYQDDRLRSDPDTVEGKRFGGTLKLSLTSPEWK